MNRRANFWRTALAVFLFVPVHAHATSAPSESSAFPQSPRIEKRIDFWTDLFAKYGANDHVIHDSRRVHKIYSVLELTSTSRRSNRNAIDREKRRIRNILLRLHKMGTNLNNLTKEEQAIVDLWKDIGERTKFRTAAYRIRAQSGLREQFKRSAAQWAAFRVNYHHRA